MMKKITLFLTTLMFPVFSNAQNTIKGSVSDSKGEPLAGAAIVGKGFEELITDINGAFSFVVPQSAKTFIVSHVGYYAKEVEVDTHIFIKVTLLKVSEDVVEVGYGTQQKSKTAMSLASINSKQLTDMPITNFVQALQGRIAGVDVTQSGSKPGALQTIRVRGHRSYSGSNEPLYVVDGMPIFDGYEDFNPHDIESIEVLKDAAATAIYGVGGANGVILITTKKGKLDDKKKTTVSYDNYYGFSEAIQLPRLFSGEEFAEFVREAHRGAASGSLYKDAAGNPVPTGVKNDFADSKISTFDANVLEGIKLGRNTQYQELLLKRGNIQNHTFGLQVNAPKVAFYASGSYFKDNGISTGLDYTRLSFHSRLDLKLTHFLKFGFSSYGVYAIRNGENSNPYSFAFRQNPLGSPYLADGVTLNFRPTNDALLTNPLFEIIKGAQIDERKTTRFFNSLYAELNIVKGLTYRANFGPDYRTHKMKRFTGSMTNTNMGTRNNQVRVSDSEDFNWTLENILNYTKDFGKHHLDFIVLHSLQNAQTEDKSTSLVNFPIETNVFGNLENGKIVGTSFSMFNFKLHTYMSRLIYDYDNRYLFTAAVRRLGNPFKSASQYDNLPAIGLGWNIANEAFIKGKINWLDALKLRASWGTVGHNTFITSGISFGSTTGIVSGAISNPNIKPERSTTQNLGLDVSILRGRIQGSLEWYRTLTNDALLRVFIATSSGFTTTTVNAGEIQNQGFEAAISTLNIHRQGFKWTSDIVFTKNKEQILSLFGDKIDDIGSKLFIGKPLSAFYDYTKDGIWQLGQDKEAAKYGSRVGQIHVTDRDNNGKITAEDRSYIGSEVPDWSGSLTNQFSYKGFDVSVMVFARIGQTIRSNFHTENNRLAGRFQQIKVDFWTPNNPTNAYPQPSITQEFPWYSSTLSYFDGSFVKIRNINIGYTVPQKWTQKGRIASLRLFTSIQQPKIWSSYMSRHNGVDPEIVEGASTSSGVTPSTRIVTMGLNMKF
jgi:TonB-linked SusC/RagA family outer membrane protein